jgi:hypothetical protein
MVSVLFIRGRVRAMPFILYDPPIVTVFVVVRIVTSKHLLYCQSQGSSSDYYGHVRFMTVFMSSAVGTVLQGSRVKPAQVVAPAVAATLGWTFAVYIYIIDEGYFRKQHQNALLKTLL